MQSCFVCVCEIIQLLSALFYVVTVVHKFIINEKEIASSGGGDSCF